MKYGFLIPGGDVRNFGQFAAEAEAAGWDGVFVADALAIEMGGKPFDWFDPWIALAAMAVTTSRVRLGTFLTPLPRRRPWKLAREVATLDHLSNGRAILSVGVGAAQDDGGFCKVGEPLDLKIRAQLMQEGLEIIGGLWKGKRFSFKGDHYKVDKMAMLPRPVQSPRVPIWVVGVWPKERSVQRALGWDGIIPQVYKWKPSDMPAYFDAVRHIRDRVAKQGARSQAFDIVTGGTTAGGNRKKAAQTIKPYKEAGCTWWIEHLWSGGPKEIVRRIKQGPPPAE